MHTRHTRPRDITSSFSLVVGVSLLANYGIWAGGVVCVFFFFSLGAVEGERRGGYFRSEKGNTHGNASFRRVAAPLGLDRSFEKRRSLE